MTESEAIKLKILGREIQVACKPGEKADLLKAAEYVEREMTAIKNRAGSPPAEKVAIITAMNLANELLQLKETSHDLSDVSTHLDDMQKQLAEALRD